METGHAKNVANFGKIKTFVTGYGAAYAPANPKLVIAAITPKFTASDLAVKAVEPVHKPYKDAIDLRKTSFAPVNAILTSAFKVLKSSDGVSDTTVNDAFTLLKKIKGTNRPPKKKTGGSEPTPDSHSTSQQSYDMRLANIVDFIALLAATPQYTPNEVEIKVANLQAGAADLAVVNTAVATAYQPYSTALKNRDTELYAPETGLYDIAAKIKTYVSGITTLSATDKKLVTSLKFTKPLDKALHL